MEDNYRKRMKVPQSGRASSGYYTYGSAVPADTYGYELYEPYYTEPARRRGESRTRTHTSVRIRNNRLAKSTISRPFLILLAGCVMCVGAMSVNILRIQYGIHLHRNNIRMMQSMTEELRVKNEGVLDGLGEYTDINRIRRVAVEECGMIYVPSASASEESKIEREYIYQHEEIPAE
jgi:hypothetical protein